MSWLHKTIRALEVKPEKGSYNNRAADRWGNHDIFPIPSEHRHYTARSYWALWIVSGITAATWSFGSSLLASGLTAGQSVGAVIIGATFASTLAYVCGRPGIRMHLG